MSTSNFDKNELKRLAGQFPSGLTVVTTRDADDRLQGCTISTVALLSCKPPLYLVCLPASSRTRQALSPGWPFAVNLLADRQAELALRFGGAEGKKYADIDHQAGITGAPLLADTSGACECRVQAIHAGGDHDIVIGRIESMHLSERMPLLYFRGSCRPLPD